MTIDIPHLSQIPDLRALWKDAFGDTDTFLDTFFSTAFSVNRCRCITMNDSVVAALYWFNCTYDNKRIAYVYAVATAATSRGQGLCHKLMADTHKHMKALGYDGVILVPGNNELFKFYESMGYKTCSKIHEFHCDSSNLDSHTFHNDKSGIRNAITLDSITKISKHDFAKRRRELLPKGAIIQEGENLDFLETQANFYAGKNFLLAARIEDETLYGLELLGDKMIAPDIVHTLGCSDGIFRTPGNDKAFAMFLSLADNISPSYFAFAFD